jgi:hypothetical protein
MMNVTKFVGRNAINVFTGIGFGAALVVTAPVAAVEATVNAAMGNFTKKKKHHNHKQQETNYEEKEA